MSVNTVVSTVITLIREIRNSNTDNFQVTHRGWVCPYLFFHLAIPATIFRDLLLSRQPISFRYHNRAALVMSALQVEKNPLCAPGPCTPVGVHSNYAIPRWRLPAIHATLTLSPPRGARPAPNSPKMKLRFNLFSLVSVSLSLSLSPSLDARC